MIASQSNQEFKRNIAYKMRIGSILSGKQIVDADRLRFIEFEDRNISRINLTANIVDKFIIDEEKKYGSITLDDATGQVKVKFFGEDIDKLKNLNQGDTILVIGLLRSWNNELYITPEIIKKKSSQYLLLRKLEIESEKPKIPNRTKLIELKDKIIGMIKGAEKDGGIDIDKIILELKESPEIINSEIKKLLEEGLIYEPRPGKIRYLG